MKKRARPKITDELRPEYDLQKLLRGAVRGKYAGQYQAGTNVVLLAPDVAAEFPDEQAVNEALRLVMTIRRMPLRRRRMTATRES